MIKNKRKLIITSLILLVVLAIFLTGGYTYSKYVTQVGGSGIIDIAIWDFNVNGSNTVMETINLAQTYDEKTLSNNAIAPGTKGSFDIVIDTRKSNTAIDYNVNFENETGKPNNLKFSYGDVQVSSIKELESCLKGRINANDEEKVKTLTIKWEWPYETGEKTAINKSDSIDTENSKNMGRYSFDVIVTGTQVEPNNVS